MDAAEAFGAIRKRVDVPLVADIHFDYRIALRVADLGVDCLRINPGNIGREKRIQAVVDKARDLNIPIRIGVNAGSLEKDSTEESTVNPPLMPWWNLPCAMWKYLDGMNFHNFKLSSKGL